ncbi:MAG: rhomboid family intramembrane serine protease [Tannerella sp.]|jgi:membrane associated rhomboid family serine protease|nr:rhomboid family intramembrane serine protease [Tannerella sp.]
MRFLFLFAFVPVYLFFDLSPGYTVASPWWTHLTYQFQHAGIMHLLVNSLAFAGMFRLLEKSVNGYLLSALIIAVGFAASFLSMHERPTVGASAMVYAMIGIFLALLALRRELKIVDRRKFALFVMSIFAGLVIGALKENSNFLLHVYALLAGALSGTILAAFRKIHTCGRK